MDKQSARVILGQNAVGEHYFKVKLQVFDIEQLHKSVGPMTLCMKRVCFDVIQ